MLNIRQSTKAWFDSWLKKRLPVNQHVTLNHKNIFIFPNRIGFLYLAIVLFMFVNSINYQNNLLFSFSCLLASVFVTSIALTYQNIAKLVVSSAATPDMFSGERAQVNIRLEAPSGLLKHGFNVRVQGSDPIFVEWLSGSEALALPFKAKKRGRLTLPRICIESVYPLGLIRTWTYVHLACEAFVYPKPIEHRRLASDWQAEGDSELEVEEGASQVKGVPDDFVGLRNYQAADSLKHVSWKHYAKTGELMTKEFVSREGSKRWLDWYALDGIDEETRLGILTYWAIEAERGGELFGLRLPSDVVPQGQGYEHLTQCLRLLACWPNGR